MMNENNDKNSAIKNSAIVLGIVVAGAFGVSALLDNGDKVQDVKRENGGQFSGREIKGFLSADEATQKKKDIIGRLKDRPQDMTINEIVEMQDFVNFKCPDGFVLENMAGGVTIEDVILLLDGHCGK